MAAYSARKQRVSQRHQHQNGGEKQQRIESGNGVSGSGGRRSGENGIKTLMA